MSVEKIVEEIGEILKVVDTGVEFPKNVDKEAKKLSKIIMMAYVKADVEQVMVGINQYTIYPFRTEKCRHGKIELYPNKIQVFCGNLNFNYNVRDIDHEPLAYEIILNKDVWKMIVLAVLEFARNKEYARIFAEMVEHLIS